MFFLECRLNCLLLETEPMQVPPSRVLIIYDDMDIAPAAVRLRAKGGHGGHNGMRSLCAHLGGNEFPRIRIGRSQP